MKKYLVVFTSCLKARLAYRMDAIVAALFGFFSVLMYYLLWRLLIPQGGTLQGFALEEMMTYIMISTALTPIVQDTTVVFGMADEIRSGKFARYLYTPIDPLGAFISQSLAAMLPPCLITTLSCVVWSAIFNGVMSPLSLTGFVCALPVLALVVAFMLLMNYLVACCAFRYTDILGIVFIRGTLLSFFSGAMAPLEVLLGGAPLWSPFYYLTNYPALLMMGRHTASPLIACAVLGGSVMVLAWLCLTVARRSRRYFEGVGA